MRPKPFLKKLLCCFTAPQIQDGIEAPARPVQSPSADEIKGLGCTINGGPSQDALGSATMHELESGLHPSNPASTDRLENEDITRCPDFGTPEPLPNDEIYINTIDSLEITDKLLQPLEEADSPGSPNNQYSDDTRSIQESALGTEYEISDQLSPSPRCEQNQLSPDTTVCPPTATEENTSEECSILDTTMVIADLAVLNHTPGIKTWIDYQSDCNPGKPDEIETSSEHEDGSPTTPTPVASDSRSPSLLQLTPFKGVPSKYRRRDTGSVKRDYTKPRPKPIWTNAVDPNLRRPKFRDVPRVRSANAGEPFTRACCIQPTLHPPDQVRCTHHP
ncbi:hypothetical protein TWF481_001945 [Arthrobotrys musiformis]|uniref:Uncharacterized protein n=1 Tax=Arthrobotrys musiformis TaxID=47236 RepID=A0AAV9VUS9_9PEZI